ncbi:MAG TPA: hypothetical protein VLL52_19885 [Anaerolineae bacterium]|nr:hypothetical protein [Anaerolineae bacterium]
MITTVTTTTTAATATLSSALTFVAIVALLALLINKEILSSSENKIAQNVGQMLNVAIVPLIFSAALVILFNVAGVIG